MKQRQLFKNRRTMNLFIHKLKISNFLSFFGEYEVQFKPFSAVMCNFYEGKDDLLRAFEFVFGSKLTDLRVDNALDLVHKVLKEEFLVSRDVHTYVEVTITVLQEKKHLKFCRSVKNGASIARIEHKISDLVISRKQYEEKLNSLGIYIVQKNLILYKRYFNGAIWGSPEDLEETICTCLRESYMWEDWKKANKKVEYLKKLKNQTSEKNYNSMKKSHSVVAKYTEKYKTFCVNRETAAKKILLNLKNDSSNESTPSPVSSTEGISLEDLNKEREVFALETKICFLSKNLDELKLKEALLIGNLHYEEVELATKPVNAEIMQTLINRLKTNIKEKEIQISEIWKEIQIITSKLENLSGKISLALVSLQDMQITFYRQNRLTQYGRFCDYLQPSRYFDLLKHIIGENLFYAHLCDSAEDAFAFLRQVKEFKHKHREVFIPLGKYSHKLKDILIASGENGIQINTLEELLIFLCKLKHYEVIDEVPVIVQKDFNFENTFPKDYTIYLWNNIYFTSEGLISYKLDESDFSQETEKELLENLAQFYFEEEINYRKWDDLIFKRWETLVDINSLENDLFCLQQKCRKSTQIHHSVHESSLLLESDEEYQNIFEEHTKEKEKHESYIQQERLFVERESSTPSAKESLNLIEQDLQNLTAEKIRIQTQLQDLTKELRRLNTVPVYSHRVEKHFIKFQSNVNKARLFLEKEFKMLKKIMRENDFEDFLGNQEWRKTFIASLIKDFNSIKMELKSATEELSNIATERKSKLYQLFDHCSRYLSSTLKHIVNDALPFVKMDFCPGEETIHIMSSLGEEKVNVVDIKHFNTLLRFLSAFSVFLEIANFEKIPFLIVDDIEEFFPTNHDNLEAVLDSKNCEKILPDNNNPRFQLLMRLGQFLQHYIKKNTPGKYIRSNGINAEYTNGPIQMIYFAKGDFLHAAEHYIWIQNQILPEEYISENCNSYSAMHEINFRN